MTHVHNKQPRVGYAAGVGEKAAMASPAAGPMRTDLSGFMGNTQRGVRAAKPRGASGATRSGTAAGVGLPAARASGNGHAGRRQHAESSESVTRSSRVALETMPLPAGVSAEVILLLLQNRLAQADDQIERLLVSINEQGSQASSLAGRSADLTELSEAIQTHGKGKRLKETHESVRHLAKRYPDLVVKGKISHDRVKSEIEQVNGKLKNANRGAELKMIRLQTLMSQRAQITSLVSNVLKTLHETQSNTIGNIR